MSTATASASTNVALHEVSTVGQESADRMLGRSRIGFARLVRIELRKMFDTRSGFWLTMSIGILSVIATGAVLIFASDEAIIFENFSTAVGIPMSVLLPVMAILAITGEWSQRSGLTTFTLVPVRGRIIGAKLAATVVVGVVSMLVAMSVGALGNVLGATVRGVDLTWGMDVTGVAKVVLASVLGMLIGFMIGTLIRNSAGALVGYFAYAFVLPTISGLLYQSQDWWKENNHWIDLQANSTQLYDGAMSASDWGYLGFTALIWVVIPLVLGVRLAMRSEVK